MLAMAPGIALAQTQTQTQKPKPPVVNKPAATTSTAATENFRQYKNCFQIEIRRRVGSLSSFQDGF